MNRNSRDTSARDVTEGLFAMQEKGGCHGSLSLRNRTRDFTFATDVTVANTYLSRLLGLLGKQSSWASAQCALWIIPSRGVHMFGMRFPIDVVFLDCNHLVIHIHENLRPWQVSRVIRSAHSVLELPVGTIARSGTKIGDQIEVVRG